MASKQQQQHVVAVPLPTAQGHLNSLMRFCKLLVQQGSFMVTFVDIQFRPNNRAEEAADLSLHHDHELEQQLQRLSTDDEDNQQAQQTLQSNKSNDDDDEQSLQQHPLIRRVHLPIHVGVDLWAGFSMRGLHDAFASIAPHLRTLILSLSPPVTCLLSDFLTTIPTQDVADQLRIPRIVLFPFCASRLLLTHYICEGKHHLSLDAVMKALEASHTRREVFCKGLPGLPTLFNTDLPHSNHVEDESFVVWNIVQRSWQVCNTRAHAVVVNSFDKLEASTLMAISKSCIVPTYGVGPWIEPLYEDYNTSLWKEDDACMTWLDQQPTSSVLYVSFGSIAMLSQTQFEEILHGLLSSGKRFLWVLRPGLLKNGASSPSPHNIMSKSHEKGFVVGWAPQLKVLSHPTIGGFLTHCGWNSTMEAIAHGVPMLCWPYFADQLLNARCIVDEWKVGLQFQACKEKESLIERGEIARGINSLMEGQDGEVVRENVRKLKAACLESLLENGTSYKNLKALIIRSLT